MTVYHVRKNHMVEEQGEFQHLVMVHWMQDYVIQIVVQDIMASGRFVGVTALVVSTTWVYLVQNQGHMVVVQGMADAIRFADCK